MEMTINKPGPKLPETTEEQALYNIIMYGDAIHSAALKTFGLSAWYKAYTQSPEFANLSNERKAEAFDTYENLKDVLTRLEEDLDELENNYPKVKI